MYRFVILFIGLLWASLLLVSWGGTDVASTSETSPAPAPPAQTLAAS